MKKKSYALITAIIGGVSTIAVGVVTYLNPAYAAAINSGIGIAATAALEICAGFVDTNK
jgi:zinc transporter ZupT